MKKILLSTIIAAATLFMVADANAQAFRVNVSGVHNKQAFYYYPRANVYYNMASRQYIIPRNGAWVVVNFLPVNFKVSNTPRFMVYHYGNDVWRDNRTHYSVYSRYRQPVIVYQNPWKGYNDHDKWDNDHDGRR